MAFPTYLLGLERRTLDLRGLPLFSVPPVSKLPVRIPLSFAAPSKTRTGSCGSSDLPSHRSARRLPDVAAHPSELPLLWFSKDRPSADIHIPRPVPVSPREGIPSALCCQAQNTFRPCRSSRLRRLTPRAALQVCCTLQPAMGFESFPVQPPSPCVSTLVGPPYLSQARTSYPSKLFPRW